MAAPFLPQAQIQAPRNAMLNFDPLNQAIDSNRRNAMLAQQQDIQREDLGMRREEHGMRQRQFDQQTQQQIRQRFGALAQVIDQEQDPNLRSQRWQQLLKLHPGAGSLDAAFRDPAQGPKLLMAEAGIVIDPLERQAKQAQLGLIRAQTAQAQAQANQRLLPPGERIRQEEIARAQGKAEGQAIADLPRVEETSRRIISQIEGVENDPRLGNVTGWEARFPTLNPKNVDVEEKIGQLGGAAFLQAFESLKGGGQITEIEGKRATDALARLTNLRQSDAGFRKALSDFKQEVKMLVDIARQRAGRAAPTTAPGANNDPLGIR